MVNVFPIMAELRLYLVIVLVRKPLYLTWIPVSKCNVICQSFFAFSLESLRNIVKEADQNKEK